MVEVAGLGGAIGGQHLGHEPPPLEDQYSADDVGQAKRH